MQIALHFYSQETGEVLSTTMVGIDPTIGDYPILSYSTTHERPQTGPNEVALYLDAEGLPAKAINGGSWIVKPDLRGRIYWTESRERVQITEIGIVPPEGALEQEPPFPLGEVKRARINLITSDCGVSIVSGFASSALGQSHHYPAKQTDQTNLMASVIDSMRPGLPENWVTPFWCADVAGQWAYRLHTAPQIQQVGADGKADILVKLQRKGQLEAQINAATTPEAVKAVAWDEPEAGGST